MAVQAARHGEVVRHDRHQENGNSKAHEETQRSTHSEFFAVEQLHQPRTCHDPAHHGGRRQDRSETQHDQGRFAYVRASLVHQACDSSDVRCLCRLRYEDRRPDQRGDGEHTPGVDSAIVKDESHEDGAVQQQLHRQHGRHQAERLARQASSRPIRHHSISLARQPPQRDDTEQHAGPAPRADGERIQLNTARPAARQQPAQQRARQPVRDHDQRIDIEPMAARCGPPDHRLERDGAEIEAEEEDQPPRDAPRPADP